MKSQQHRHIPSNVRRVTAAVALALSAGAPFAAHAEAPKVTWKAPLSGSTIKGSISGSTCAVDATSSVGMQRVIFWISQMQINNDYSSPWNCSFDSTKLRDGSYTMWVEAYSSKGEKTVSSVGVKIANTTTVTPTPTPTATPTPTPTPTPTATPTPTPTPTITPISTVTPTAAPTSGSLDVWFKAPTAGKTLSGVLNLGTSCYVNGIGVSRVQFFLDSTALNTDSYVADGMQCLLDTTKFANGTHQLKATAYSSTGASRSDLISINIQNSSTTTTTPTPTPTPTVTPTPTPTPTPTATSTSISASDIMGHARADVPFAQQSGYSGQVIGQFPYVTAIPETGINGSTLPNGETLRLGKAADPVNSSRKALAFQLAPTDPMTSSSKRAEISFPPKIEPNKTYWVAFSAYLYDWGTLSGGDQSLFGTQVHSGDSSRGLSPAFTLVTYCCKNTFQVAAMYSTNSSPTPSNTVTTKSAEVPIPFGRWADFVFKFRESQSSSGFVQAWMDGNQIMNYQGPLGYSTPGYLDYVKFGYYNWSSFTSSRKVLLRSPVVVLDPTGSQYQVTDLRSFVQAN